MVPTVGTSVKRCRVVWMVEVDHARQQQDPAEFFLECRHTNMVNFV